MRKGDAPLFSRFASTDMDCVARQPVRRAVVTLCDSSRCALHRARSVNAMALSGVIVRFCSVRVGLRLQVCHGSRRLYIPLLV